MLQDVGVEVFGSQFGVQGLGFRGSGFRGLGLRVWAVGSTVHGSQFMIEG
jgi:hypothetical protein